MNSELAMKNLGQFRMTDAVTTAESLDEAVTNLKAADSEMTSRIGGAESKISTIQIAAVAGREFLGLVNNLYDVQEPKNGDMVAVKSDTDQGCVKTYIYCVPVGEENGEWYLFGDDQKVYGVNALPDIGGFSIFNVGRIYLLGGNQEGYVKGHFYRVAQDVITGDLYWEDFLTKDVPLANVQNIRFSFISGTLAVCWRDPDDLVIDGEIASRWARTVLVVKQGEYPTSPTDGTAIITTTVRNQHLNDPAIVQLDESAAWYARFFPCNESRVYTIDTKSTSNCFTTESYSWNDVTKTLEDYEKFNALLPKPGDTVYLDYIISDYWLEGTTKVAANTRQLVMDNIDKLSAVAYPWRVLGYDSNVPQYVKYRHRREGTQLKHRFDNKDYEISTTDPQTGVITLGEVVTDYQKYDMVYFRNITTGQLDNYMFDGEVWRRYEAFAEYDYLWVSSVDDALSAFDVSKFDGSSAGTSSFMMGVDEKYGPGWMREIKAGARTYAMSYDVASGIKTYTPAENSVVSVINEGDVFGYSNGGVGRTNVYYVPRTLSVENAGVFTFCGHTMTVQPQNCLNGVTHTGTHYNNIWFDAAENKQYGLVYNKYDTFSEAKEDYGYYWRDGQVLHRIDVYGEELGGRVTQEYNGHDVYKAMPNGSLKNQSLYYVNGRKYAKLVDSLYVDLINCFEYKDKTAYAANTYVATYADPGDAVPDAIYKVTTAVDATNTNPPASNPAFTLDTTGLLADVKYAVVGRKIPTDIQVYLKVPDDRRKKYGSNIYAESNYRQYINNINGSADAHYTEQSPIDVVSTSGLMNVNGPMLKLSKNGDFVASIVPAVNLTILATAANQYCYRTYKTVSGSYVEHTIDLFWPLAQYETFGNANDGTVWFKEVLGTDVKRIKYYLKSNGTKDNAAYWWLRTPNTGYPHGECIVTTSGISSDLISNNPRGCAPACLIG